jgi:hypothetical protein
MKIDLRFSYDREPDMLYHRTQIRFSEFSVSFIGSLLFFLFSLGTATLLLLLLLFFSYCNYFSPIIILLSLLLFFLLLFLFSHYYCLSLIGITLLFITFFPLLLFFSCGSDFSHMVFALFVRSHLIIKTDFN